MKFFTSRKPFRYDKIFIIATRGGMSFALITLTMFFASAAYSNNLVYLLTFLVLSLNIAALIITNFNINGLRIDRVMIDPDHDGESTLVKATISNTSSQDRSDIAVVAILPDSKESVSINCPFIKAGETLIAEGQTKLGKRGVYQLSYVRFESSYPVGLWYSWFWQRISCEYLVFPRVQGSAQPPQASTGLSPANSENPQSQGDDFTGHKRVEPGGSLQHIDWHIFARTQEFWRKEFHDHEQGSYRLSWYTTEQADTESKLSQLCAWIDTLDRQHLTYSLELPGLTIPTGGGAHHRLQCLEALARYAA